MDVKFLNDSVLEKPNQNIISVFRTSLCNSPTTEDDSLLRKYNYTTHCFNYCATCRLTDMNFTGTLPPSLPTCCQCQLQQRWAAVAVESQQNGTPSDSCLTWHTKNSQIAVIMQSAWTTIATHCGQDCKNNDQFLLILFIQKPANAH